MASIWSRYLGQSDLPGELSQVEIDVLFALTEGQLAATEEVKTPQGKLGLALQICFLRLSGRLLGSTDLVAPQILATLAAQLNVAAPTLASMRSFYKRRQTRFDHQQRALDVIGFRRTTAGAVRQLGIFLSGEAHKVVETDALVHAAMTWLYGLGYVLPSQRRLVELANSARERVDWRLREAIGEVIAAGVREGWIETLSLKSGRSATLFEDLCHTPKGRGIPILEQQGAKIKILKSLGADRLNEINFSPTLLANYAARVAARSVNRLWRTLEPLRTVEIACFLHHRLLVLSDQLAQMIDHQIGRIWGRAYRAAQTSERAAYLQHQKLIQDFNSAIKNPELDDAGLGRLVRSRMADAAPILTTSRLAKTRAAFAVSATDVRRIGSVLLTMKLEHAACPKVTASINVLTGESEDTISAMLQTAGPSWQRLHNIPPSQAALAAAVVMLKRCLRNGKLGIVHSLDHRAPEERLIAHSTWTKQKARFLLDQSLPATGETFVASISPALSSGLKAVQDCILAGDLNIDSGRMIVPRPGAAPLPSKLKATRNALINQIGPVQLPNILIDVDMKTRFSTLLLGHPPRNEDQLVTVYAAILALGTDQSAAAIARSISGVDPRMVTRCIDAMTADPRLRGASDVIVAHTATCDIASLWGNSISASADMMSLETARHLWSARIDPRRGTPSVGTYTHVLDQWSIIFDQPILLGRRQAGVAIEGALRQTVAPTLSRIAVDTHGHTHFAMALAKFCSLDLCPRLAGLSKRKLYLPKEFKVPTRMEAITSTTIDPKTIAQGYDEFLRVAASVQSGRCAATYAMDWFGSAARGDKVYEAGIAIGKLLLTMYLCDWLTKPSFQREIGHLLSQGEAVHILQRAINPRPIAAKAGRDQAELTAISHAMSLLTNIVIAWNTNAFDEARRSNPALFPDAHLKHIAPIAYAHINMRGTMTFDLSGHAQKLFSGPTYNETLMSSVN
jgi:TnpA family transposase